MNGSIPVVAAGLPRGGEVGKEGVTVVVIVYHWIEVQEGIQINENWCFLF